MIEEVTIVSHGEDCAGVSSEVLLEPQDRFGVEVVGGLIEEQQVGLAQQQLAERNASLLTTGEVGDHLFRRGAAQASIACSSCESISHASA